jgi:hypothetical protein
MQHINELLREFDLTHKKSSVTAEFKNSIKLNKIKTDETEIPLGSIFQNRRIPRLACWLGVPLL